MTSGLTNYSICCNVETSKGNLLSKAFAYQMLTGCCISICANQTQPCAFMASATFRKPAMLAPAR